MSTQDEQSIRLSGTNRDSIPSNEQVTPQVSLLQQFKANMTTAFENVPSGIYLYDHLGRILLANVLGARLLGYASVEEVLQQHDLAQMRQRFYASYSVENEDGTPFRPELGPVGRAIQEQRDIQLITRYIHKQSQQRFWALCRATPVFDEHDRLTNVIYSITDITQQKDAEGRLREQARLLQVANDAFIVQDGENRISFWSQGAERLYGFSAEEAVGKRVYELLHTQFPVSLAQIYAFLQTNSSWRGDLLQTTKTGRVITVESRWELLKHEQTLKVLEINRDITERKALEQQKDDFIRVASHELNTPITGLKGYAELLWTQFQRAGDERAAQLLARMNEQIDHLIVLLREVLDITQLETGQMFMRHERCDLQALLRKYIEEVQRTTQTHRIVLEVGEPAACWVDVDPQRIGQVVTNLLTNAIKYAPAAPLVEVRLTRGAGEVICSVQDGGPGIAAEQQVRLFKRFSRINSANGESSQGLGLGLYLVSQIIERHGGHIWVESEEGKGAAFLFSLPMPSVPTGGEVGADAVEAKGTDGEETLSP